MHARLAENKAYVLYHKPHTEAYTRIVSQTAAQNYYSLEDVPEHGGYIVAPFVVTAECPILYFDDTEAQTFPLDCLLYDTANQLTTKSGILSESDSEQEYIDYKRSFSKIHSTLREGKADKIVLSRSHSVCLRTEPKPEMLFAKACVSNPNCFVALWHSEQCGTWLVATPELLFASDGKQGHTMALAGTLPYPMNNAEPEWDEKNRREQQLVCDFLLNTLRSSVTNIRTTATFTLHSANLCHLCTKFSFDIHKENGEKALLSKLHPTPAVCGLPREEAFAAISNAENNPRRYYAGYSGLLHPGKDTQLYVSLRCMEYDNAFATLYAGGGIMPESIEENEWEETCRKMLPMRTIL